MFQLDVNQLVKFVLFGIDSSFSQTLFVLKVLILPVNDRCNELIM